MTNQNKTSAIISQKIDELQGQESYGGDLSRHVIITNEDKIKLAVQDFMEKRKYVGEWSSHLTTCISLVLGLLSCRQIPPSATILGGLTTVQVMTGLWLLLAVFCFILLRSAWATWKNRKETDAQSLINRLDKTSLGNVDSPESSNTH